MKRFVLLTMLLAALALVASIAASGDDGAVFGPFAGASPDSGTCLNDWASDTFVRVFKVTDNGDGTFLLREEFKNGTFTTVAGPSPGGCEADSRHGATVVAGVTGSFQGSLQGTVTGGTFDPNATCPTPCTGAGFVPAFFGAGASWNVDTFSFNYHALDQGLSFRHWVNASENRGGNRGDIASS